MRSSDNLLMLLRRVSPSAFLPKIEVSSARSRESFGTSCSSEATGSCHTGGPFLFRTVAAGGGLGGTRGKRSSSSVAWSRFPLASSFLDAGRTSGLSSLIFIFIHVWCMSWICWSSLSQAEGYMSLLLTRLLTRLGRWLRRKIRQVQYTMSHCGVLSWRGVQTKKLDM